MKLNESASSGATSSGGIATVVQPLNFPLIRRLPNSNIFGYVDEVGQDKKKKKKNN